MEARDLVSMGWRLSRSARLAGRRVSFVPFLLCPSALWPARGKLSSISPALLFFYNSSGHSSYLIKEVQEPARRVPTPEYPIDPPPFVPDNLPVCLPLDIQDPMLRNELFVCEIPLPRPSPGFQASFKPVLVAYYKVLAVEGFIPYYAVDYVWDGLVAGWSLGGSSYPLPDGVCSQWNRSWGREVVLVVGLGLFWVLFLFRWLLGGFR